MTQENVVQPQRGLLPSDQAVVAVTWARQYVELPDPVLFDSTQAGILSMVEEAIRGGFPGMTADPNVNLEGFIVSYYEPIEQRPWRLIQVSPKTEYGDLRA